MWLSRTLAALEGLWTLGSYSNLYQHGDCLTGRFLDFMRSFLLRDRKRNCDKDFIYENIALPPSPLNNDLFLKLKDRRLKKWLLMSFCPGHLPASQNLQIYNQIHLLPTRQITSLRGSLTFCICKMGTIVVPHSSNSSELDFSGGPMVKHPPANAGEVGLIPGRGTKIPPAATTEPVRHN